MIRHKHGDETTRRKEAQAVVRGLFCLGYALLLSLCAAGAASAQSLDVKIKVVSVSPALVHVEGRRQGDASRWSFRNFYAGASGLAERVENFTLADESGAVVAVNKLAPGEFKAAKPATRFSYNVKLDAPAFVSDAAHVSWLTA